MQAWQKFVAELENEFGSETVSKWLHTLKVVNFDAGNLYLEAKDSFQAMWFDEHIRPKLNAFVGSLNKPIKVHIAVSGTKSSSKKREGKAKQLKTDPTSPFFLYFDELDPTATLDAFLLHDEIEVPYRLLEELCNKLVDSKLQAMQSFSPKAQSTKNDIFNPIYIYGPKGAGKTHLLQGLTQKFRRVGYQVIFARAELFCDHVVRAIRVGEMAKFREHYRKADILIIDDVQVFGKKAATQEEFFHTFNALHMEGKQILLAANVAPQSLQYIEPRLVSRFEWGIALQLKAPQKRELSKILEKRAECLRYPISIRCVEFLAETFANNPKAAVLALNALILRTHTDNTKHQREVTLTEAKKLLADLIEKEKASALTLERIIHAVSEHYAIPVEDLIGKSQARECVVPRQIAMYLCREELKAPFMKIGDIFERDHSTVMSAVRQVQKQLASIDNPLAPTLALIQQKLR